MVKDELFRTEEYNMKSDVAWRFRDVFLVTLIIYVSSFFAFPLLELLFKSDRTFMHVFLYFVDFLTLFAPVLWIQRFHMMEKGALGIRKGRWPVVYIVTIGVGVGVGCFLVVASVWGPKLKMNQFLIDHLIKIILLPLSIVGFRGIVLAPIGEEVFFRGFLYGYLRSKLGIKVGLLAQSLIFSFLHADYAFGTPFSFVLQRLMIGLILGILYERSYSVYPSIICHSTINFLFSIAIIQRNLGG